MKKEFVTLFLILSVSFAFRLLTYRENQSGAPPYGLSEEDVPKFGSIEWSREWVRPNVPAKVAIQAGHYMNDELPSELERLRDNDGSAGGGKHEWEVNLAISEEIKSILNENGIEAEILPATIPPRYWADVFIAIHADGSENTSKRGFKIAKPWRDFSGKADRLISFLRDEYQEETGFSWDDNITQNMRGYYAFSWWKFEHAIHPMTTAVIFETGFLTNYYDRQIIVNQPDIAAQAIAKGVMRYLESEGLVISD